MPVSKETNQTQPVKSSCSYSSNVIIIFETVEASKNCILRNNQTLFTVFSAFHFVIFIQMWTHLFCSCSYCWNTCNLSILYYVPMLWCKLILLALENLYFYTSVLWRPRSLNTSIAEWAQYIKEFYKATGHIHPLPAA